ncbi:hypothetical protein DTO027I6_8320 [Penicillium roqueforti]|nr:hypothetical protein CBS147354_2219 [Penicillium roqueforti]KAI3123382.1 hypothetical protein CBS147326_8686 [Penicillium roqueforti]KAI3191207.1 hypothetical protein DTO027I6_8320 [Penicillium roqueforti]KAI3268117.1 hypothetical protein CBS147308_6256 [Penicillium roqueforti]KAI3289413.1 hypothetical protein DTO003C3_5325 [Penicillium roqueforti]
MYKRERLERRDREKWQLMKAHDASRANRQFDAQVYELEARIIEGIENRTLDVPDGTNMNNLAHETVKKNWMKQGIWNEEWEHVPQPWWMWRHEELPEVTPAPKIDLDRLSRSRGEEPTKAGFWDKKIPHSGERKAKQKPGDEPSRPFHQFIYQISKERERVQNASDSPDSPSSVSALTNINTEAYEHVKSIWIKRGIWNDQWGILPGMVWKHEITLQIPDNDRDLSPSPTVPSEHVTFNQQPRPPLFDGRFSTQADGPDQAGSPAPADGPAQVDGPASNGGQRTTKRKRAAAPVGPKKARRKVSATLKPEISRSRPAVDNLTNKSVLPDQGTQDTGRRRSRRIQKRNKSN